MSKDEKLKMKSMDVLHPSSYSFTMDQLEDMENHLREEGFAVVKGVAEAEHIENATDLLFDYLESIEPRKVKRNDSATWTDDNGWPDNKSGFLTLKNGGGHCPAAWYVRTLPNIKRAFEQIWHTPELLVSFDTFIGWRPWWSSHNNKNTAKVSKPTGLRYHLDQNIHNKSTFQCVQGMLALRPITETIGGLSIVPRSHLWPDQRILKDRNVHWSGHKHDWCVVHDDTLRLLNQKPMIVLADPGDLILWDSRIVHGSCVGPGPSPCRPDDNKTNKSNINSNTTSSSSVTDDDEVNNNRMARLAFVVCMTPKYLVLSKDILKKRRQAFENGESTTHWPHEYLRHPLSNTWRGWKPPELNSLMDELID